MSNRLHISLIFNRRKKTAGLCGELRKRIAVKMDGGEEQIIRNYAKITNLQYINYMNNKPIGRIKYALN